MASGGKWFDRISSYCRGLLINRWQGGSQIRPLLLRFVEGSWGSAAIRAMQDPRLNERKLVTGQNRVSLTWLSEPSKKKLDRGSD